MDGNDVDVNCSALRGLSYVGLDRTSATESGEGEVMEGIE